MKKILILLSLSILLTSCYDKTEEKTTLDKEDKKIVENVLWITDSVSKTEEVKTEEEVIKNMEDETKTEKVAKDTDKKITNLEKEENKKNPEAVKVETKKTETKVKEEVKISPEDEKEAENLLNELLGGESDVNNAIKNIEK